MSSECDWRLEYWPAPRGDPDRLSDPIDVKLVRFIGHEFNNVLQSMTNFADDLTEIKVNIKNYNKNDELFTYIDVGSYLSSRLFLLTNRYDSINYNVCTENIIEKFVDEEDIIVNVILHDPLPGSHCYTDGVLVALGEIVSNARESRSHRSAIEMNFRRFVADHAGMPRPCLSITVRDFGCGMPEATMANLFSGPFTTKRNGVARGLGLSIVARALEGMGGGILISSSPGTGTEVELMIPEAAFDDARNGA